jgi:uncharacterized SAM-binding protein YcdF (DUF218 family)
MVLDAVIRAFRLLFVVLLAAVVVTAVVLVSSASTMPRRVDAVVVLAGGRGERLAHARTLVREGRTRTLVISHGYGWPAARALCRRGVYERAQVVCFEPQPDTTKGEAIAVRRLATSRGWRSIAVVTSTYHMRRSLWLTRRCSPSDVSVSSSPARPLWSSPGTWAAVIREEGALLKSLAVDRRC